MDFLIFWLPYLYLIIAAGLLITLIVIDIKEWLLPNIYVFPFAVLGILFHVTTGFTLLDSSDLFLGFIAGGGTLLAIRTIANGIYKTDTLGLGDVKLLAAAGLWLGLHGVILSLILGASAGLVHGVIYWAYLNFYKKKKTSFRRLKMPAGPGFIAGIILAAFIPNMGVLNVFW